MNDLAKILVPVGIGGLVLALLYTAMQTDTGAEVPEYEAAPVEIAEAPEGQHPVTAAPLPSPKSKIDRPAVKVNGAALATPIKSGDGEAVDVPPPKSAEEWDKYRSEQHEKWMSTAKTQVDGWMTTQGLSADEQAGVNSAIDGLIEGIGTVRNDITNGNISPAEGRKETKALKERIEGQLIDAIGEGRARGMVNDLPDARLGLFLE